MCIAYINRKASMAFTAVCQNERFTKATGSHILCESSIVSQKWCKINTLLAQTTNRKCHMAYWIVPVAMTFEWPSRSAVASLRPYHNRNSSNIYATFAPRDPVPTLSLLSLYLLTISVRSSTGKICRAGRTMAADERSEVSFYRATLC